MWDSHWFQGRKVPFIDYNQPYHETISSYIQSYLFVQQLFN